MIDKEIRKSPIADWARYSCYCSKCKTPLEDATWHEAKDFIDNHQKKGCCIFTEVITLRII